jgi:hypothetical protein
MDCVAFKEERLTAQDGDQREIPARYSNNNTRKL